MCEINDIEAKELYAISVNYQKNIQRKKTWGYLLVGVIAAVVTCIGAIVHFS